MRTRSRLVGWRSPFQAPSSSASSFSFSFSSVPQSLQAEVESTRAEVGRYHERSEELEQVVEDKKEESKIIEKKSNSMVCTQNLRCWNMHEREG